jgi:hypothetical protein
MRPKKISFSFEQLRMIIGQEYSRANQDSASDPNEQTPTYGMKGAGRPR